MNWILIGIIIIAFLVSAIPLHLAVILLGGKTNLIKTAIVGLLAGIVAALVKSFLPFWGAFIAFIVLIWIYREAFKLRWWKAFLAWILQFIILAIFIIILIALAVI